MQKILFIMQQDSKKGTCGVYLIGKQYYDLLRESGKYDVVLIQPNSILDIRFALTANNPLAVIINYNPTTTPWADVRKLQKELPHIPFIRLDHEMTQLVINEYVPETNNGFFYCISPDTTLDKLNPHIFHINRLMAYGFPIEQPPKDCTWIGFQGFGFDHKGIPKIAKQVVKEFDRAIIRLHIPPSTYGDPMCLLAKKQVEIVNDIVRGTNVIVSATHHIMSSIELIQWLSQNDVNCYLYDDNALWGIASAPDYAIAARRPIAVSRSQQLRYIWKNVPDSLIDNSSLRKIISNGFNPFESLYQKMSRWNVLDELEKTLNQIIYLHRI
jgi:hypothetical protein